MTDCTAINQSICIPAAPPVSVATYLPLIKSKQFQALRGRKQLGINDLVFPGAQHTRFEHALGTLALTQRLAGLHHLPAEERRLLEAFALLHDIGHGPFSHQIEPVLSGSHHEHGCRCLEQLEAPLRECGLDVSQLTSMMLEQHPLAVWVADRNLGTDKLDYLHRDALHIGFRGIPDIERLQYVTRLTPEGLAVDSKFLEEAKQLQKFYSYLHQHGYLNKTALIAQRMLQRAVHEELRQRNQNGEELWDMQDRQLLAWLESATSDLARELASRLEWRHLHNAFLTLKPRGYGFAENSSGKDLAVIERPLDELRSLAQKFQAPDTIRLLENSLADKYRLPAGSILVAAMPYYTKLIPKDLRIANSQGGFWLLEADGDHLRSLKSDYQRTFAIRVLAVPEARRRLAAKAEDVLSFLLEWS